MRQSHQADSGWSVTLKQSRQSGVGRHFTISLSSSIAYNGQREGISYSLVLAVQFIIIELTMITALSSSGVFGGFALADANDVGRRRIVGGINNSGHTPHL